MPAVTRVISITNFMVASSALCFQVGVLYPWHKELDENFEKLKKEHLMVLDLIKNSADLAAEREKRLGHQQPQEASKKGLREWLGLGPRSLE
ncbi:unnamed protein product [Discula destructiva]